MHLPWRDVVTLFPGFPATGPPISTSITDREAGELGRLAAGQQVLEVGSAYGFSAVTMALAGGQVTAVDPHGQLGSYDVMLANLAAYHVTGQVEIIKEPSAAALPWLAGEQALFGLVFIDGDHTAAAVYRDITLALPLLAPGGTLACHDLTETCCCPGVRVACNEMFPGGPDDLIDSLAIYVIPLYLVSDRKGEEAALAASGPRLHRVWCMEDGGELRHWDR